MSFDFRHKAFGLTAMIALMSATQASSQANLMVTDFRLSPATPTQGQPVNVRIKVLNKGTQPAGPFHVEWWPGENFATGAACNWNVPGLGIVGETTLNCTYPGYPSWYSNIKTRVILDTGNTVAEANEADNDRRYPIRVRKAAVVVPLAKPNLFISEMSLTPSTPVQGQPVQVRIGVYNNGDTASGPSRVEWWPGENYPSSACGWNVGPLVKNGGRILTCTYPGYPSWYGNIKTKAVADVNNTVAEKDESDNVRRMNIRVNRP